MNHTPCKNKCFTTGFIKTVLTEFRGNFVVNIIKQFRRYFIIDVTAERLELNTGKPLKVLNRFDN